MSEQALEQGFHKTRRWVREAARISRQIRFPGREKLLRATLGPELFRCPHGFEEVIPYGKQLKIRCNPSSYVEWVIYMKGCYDFGITRLLPQLLAPGSYAVDVGANIGAYTLLMADCVGTAGRVAAFEPNPEVFDRLHYNLNLNGFSSRVEARGIALSSAPGRAALHLPSAECSNRGVASMRACTELDNQTIKVAVETLDNLLGSWPRCDLLKVDVEGHDAAVLKGSREIIGRYFPSLIFECNLSTWPDPKSGWEELRGWLFELGYSIYWLDSYLGRLRRVEALPETERNIVALHPHTSPIAPEGLKARARTYHSGVEPPGHVRSSRP